MTNKPGLLTDMIYAEYDRALTAYHHALNEENRRRVYESTETKDRIHKHFLECREALNVAVCDLKLACGFSVHEV